jgi:hypothetical protein
MRRGASRSGPAVDSEALVPILAAHVAPGYRIPRRRSRIGGMELDHDRIRRINESTAQAAALLAVVFDAANERQHA